MQERPFGAGWTALGYTAKAPSLHIFLAYTLSFERENKRVKRKGKALYEVKNPLGIKKLTPCSSSTHS